jgi:hypothetical protein
MKALLKLNIAFCKAVILGTLRWITKIVCPPSLDRTSTLTKQWLRLLKYEVMRVLFREWFFRQRRVGDFLSPFKQLRTTSLKLRSIYRR